MRSVTMLGAHFVPHLGGPLVDWRLVDETEVPDPGVETPVLGGIDQGLVDPVGAQGCDDLVDAGTREGLGSRRPVAAMVNPNGSFRDLPVLIIACMVVITTGMEPAIRR